MSLFETSPKQKIKLYEIATSMKASGVDDSFIANGVEIGLVYEGVFDLFELWAEEKDQNERNIILADIQDEIDEYKEQPKKPFKQPYITYDDLQDIAKNVESFKAHLKSKVDQWGGVTKLARETGMPQSSLSRFFTSSRMPRRSTLYKIAIAMRLPQREIITDWVA